MNHITLALLKETKNFLSFHQLLGIEEYPARGSFLSFLRPAAPPKKSAPPFLKKPETTSLSKSTAELKAIQDSALNCNRCRLHENRKNIVFGAGTAHPKLMIIGDWPGQEDEQTGNPFQGPEGEMLTNMLKAINLSREEAYITTLVKCRPPEGRPPTKEEITTCLPYIYQQIAAVEPMVICTMGPLATQTLLKTDQRLIQLRGHFHNCRSVPLMPTFHPSFLLENPEMKKATWRDLLAIQKKLGL